ncbi:MAG: substrate-binding domain-containing protein, partial [Oscillospiraceae bacterium]|nr:substrate-binding domain-containing protein [Oscillospiraceae bacterium]
MKNKSVKKILASVLALSVIGVSALAFAGCQKADTSNDSKVKITNVSYDPTRELYEQVNPLFEQYYEEKHGEQIKVVQSHGGSGAQARSVVEGCNADVVTLALEHDISLIERTGLIEPGWKEEFERDSAPYTSIIVFLVRKGNEKNIR